MGVDCNDQDTAVFSSASYAQEPWEVDLGLGQQLLLAQVQWHRQQPAGTGMVKARIIR